MFKALARSAQKKQNFMITVRIARFGLESINEDTTFLIVWKRGPEKQNSSKVELNEFEVDADLEDVMSKVSSFYSKDHVTYEKKMCNFCIVKVDEDGTQTEVAHTEVNMAEFVNHTDSAQRLEIHSDEYSGMFLEVKWTISETAERNG